MVVGAYQHGKYLADCIDSIRAQTTPPDRILIVDDGSTDGTQAIAQSFGKDIALLDLNRVGPSVVFNKGVELIQTDVVAIISGDDRMLPDRLEKQVKAIAKSGAEIHLGLPVIIDQHGEHWSDSAAPEFFPEPSHLELSLTAKLFFSGNFLCAPTALFRRSAYFELGGFYPGLLQLQDFHLWCRWSARGTIEISGDRLVEYRKCPQSLSGAANIHPMHAERLWIYRHFFDAISDDAVHQLFPPDKYQCTRKSDLSKALLYLQHADPLIRNIGCEKLLDFCTTDSNLEELAAVGLSIQDVFSLVGEYSPTKIFDQRKFVQENILLRQQMSNKNHY